MRIHRILLLAVVCTVLLLPTAAPSQGPPLMGDWVVDEDTHLSGEAVDVDGNVTVSSGVRLTLEGSHLRVGGLLYVEPNATLELLPSAGHPSSLSPFPGGTGFWIHIEGRLLSQGEDSAEIMGLWGNGLLSTLPGEEGGLRISGRADLEGIRIHNSTAGVVVSQGGVLNLHGSAVGRLGEAGITTRGSLYLGRTSVAENDSGIIGKDTCDIRIDDSVLRNDAEQLIVNGCRAVVDESTLTGASVAVVANNRANITVQDTTIQGYGTDALNAFANPAQDEPQVMLRPVARFHDVSLEPGPGARRAADVSGAELIEFVNVTVAGHGGHGLDVIQSVLAVRDSVFEANGGFGIRLTDGRFLEDPLESGNRFGASNQANREGAISSIAVVSFAVVDGRGIVVPLEQDVGVGVYRMGTGEGVEVLRTKSVAPGVVQVFFDIYETDSEGQPVFLGPFRYEATHPAWDEAATGVIDMEEGLVLLTTERGNSSENRFLRMGALAGLGFAVASYGLWAFRRHRSTKGPSGEERTDEG